MLWSWSRLARLVVCSNTIAYAHRRLRRASLPHSIDPESDAAPPLQHLEDISDPVEDIELRQKPPHVQAEEGTGGGLMAGDLQDLLNEDRNDMGDCVVIHQYAEPLQVGDSVRVLEGVRLSRRNDSKSENVPVPPLVRQGAIWDESARSNSVPLEIEMFAHLQGITGLVQVIPHGPVAKWTSKQKVPLGGFLCSHSGGNHSVSAPVLHATPTPCVPTALDQSGKALNPLEDGYEVFVGTTRLRFDDKAAANSFCWDYARRIASDLSRTVWDASALGELLPERNPSVASFVARTGKMTSPEGWTKGRKRLLVVVMDWKLGDRSLSPYSRQAANPIQHYQNVIFPEVNKAFERMSYGQFGLDVTFVPEVIHYTRERSRYTARKMPFPALYDAARDALEGQRSDYLFSSYDLVYVVAPQVNPTGTKGVAWVGMKGAMCNGCETISDKFKIMVAVHELGHNLGLMHASSTSLEYGNPFDWMGNYPDVLGLNYGLGYVWSLGWLPSGSVYTLGDRDLPGLSVVVVVTPHDAERQLRPGQVAGVRVSLAANSRDLWVAYRSSPEGYRSGVFLVQQEKDEANSELIDSACHSPSQQDASLRVGWVYMDKSQRLAVKVLEVTEGSAKVHIFEVKPEDVPGVYALPDFTDGETKCPVTCQDANWLVTGFNCPTLKEQGYCTGGSLTLQGTSYKIGLDICPQECGRCDEVMRNTPLKVQGGCQDRSIKISGKNCAQVASSGWCGYQTQSGSSVGADLCPVSCGQCPRTVAPSKVPFVVPEPKTFVGGSEGGPVPPSLQPSEGQDTATTVSGDDGATAATDAAGGKGDEPAEKGQSNGCEDDPSWADAEGDTCADYAKVILDGTLSQSAACDYNGGLAKPFCRKTCDTCTPTANNCADSMCITTFKQVTGRCEQCSDWSRFCTGKTASWFKVECPLTCGVCSPSSRAIARVPPSSASAMTAPEAEQNVTKTACSDDDCVAAWRLGDKCPTCSEMGRSFCSEEVFASACPRTCDVCTDKVLDKTCKDIFSSFTCGRYKTYGWCTRPDMRGPVSRQCPHTCGLCGPNAQATPQPESPGLAAEGEEGAASADRAGAEVGSEEAAEGEPLRSRAMPCSRRSLAMVLALATLLGACAASPPAGSASVLP